MKNTAVPFSALLISAVLSGCAYTPKHEVDISAAMREAPVRQVHVLAPFFPKDVKRQDPKDFREMLPENQASSATTLQEALKRALGASVSIDSAWVPDAKTLAWAKAVSEELLIQRIPLGVASATIPVESVLITGVIAYGMEKDQMFIHFLPFLPGMKKRPIGELKWDHVCDLVCLLVRPADGTVLFSLRHEERSTTPYEDPELLKESVARAASAVRDIWSKAADK